LHQGMIAKLRLVDLYMKLFVPTWRQTLLVVVVLALGLFLSVGRYDRSIQRSREAVCMQDTYRIREAISQYTLDKNQPPKSLQDLVEAHYLGAIPTHACMQELDSPPVLEDPVSRPNLATFRLTNLN
jgi:type II secretory pathway pseudopilin PulG